MCQWNPLRKKNNKIPGSNKVRVLVDTVKTAHYGRRPKRGVLSMFNRTRQYPFESCAMVDCRQYYRRSSSSCTPRRVPQYQYWSRLNVKPQSVYFLVCITVLYTRKIEMRMRNCQKKKTRNVYDCPRTELFSDLPLVPGMYYCCTHENRDAHDKLSKKKLEMCSTALEQSYSPTSLQNLERNDALRCMQQQQLGSRIYRFLQN